MRLFLLPISTRQSLIYCQKRSRLPGQASYIDRITSKASERWMLWEKYEKGWQKKVTVYGNKLFQRLSYEEWGLKSVPSLSAKRRAEELEGKTKSTVEYPGTVLKPEEVSDILRRYGSNEKQSYHRKWLWATIIGMPITIPVALIPVIPNLPFFYMVFRAWSHWRAICGSKHIDFLLDNKLFDLAPSPTLDTSYTVQKIGVSLRAIEKEVEGLRNRQPRATTPTDASHHTSEEMLLSQSDATLIAKCLDVPEIGPEVERAVWQVEKYIKAGKELLEEKTELEKANTKI